MGGFKIVKDMGDAMDGINVIMALVDFIPVLFFSIAAVILARDLYNKMVKGAFALLAAGTVMVLISGLYKAAWKILYALNICDFVALDVAFFPTQAPGFLLVFISLIAMLTRKSQSTTPLCGAGLVPIYDSNLIFIMGQTIGCAGTQWLLFFIAKRMKRAWAMVLFVLSFIAMLGMGYLSAKFDDSSTMHWIAQCTNIVSQGALLGGVMVLHKAGLNKPDALGGL